MSRDTFLSDDERHLAWHCLAILAVGLMTTMLWGARAGSGSGSFRIQRIGTIRVSGSNRIRLEDVDSEGRALVLDSGRDGLREQSPELLLWDPAKKTFAPRFTKSWGPLPAGKGLVGCHIPRAFRLVDSRGDIVGVFGCDLAVIDGELGTLRKVLCSPELMDPHSPYNEKTAPWSYVHGAVIARYKYSGLVAAAFNFGKWPRLFLLRAPWKAPYASWRMDRFVKALAWSPSGNTLAVLYSNVYNNDLKFVMRNGRGHPMSRLPNVVLIDVKTGKSRLKFFTGDFETSIAFSSNGKFIYCADYTPTNPTQGWVIREFAVSNGKLVRKFKRRGLQLKGNLAVSPDGRLLVADANSTRWSLGVIFNDTYGYDRRFRFVILDTTTGKVVFKHEEKVEDTLLSSPPTFAFSPDGKYLYVDPHLHGSGSPEIQVYSLREGH